MKIVAVVLIASLQSCGPGVNIPPLPPTPTVTPEDVPTPEPSVLPPPSPAPTSGIVVCTLPPSIAPQSGCIDRPAGPHFAQDVAEAQRLALNNGFVDPDGIVIGERAYTSEVARVLRSMGLCATNEGLDDEVWVKNTNDYSEHYDIVISDGRPWDLFAARCTPAKF